MATQQPNQRQADKMKHRMEMDWIGIQIYTTKFVIYINFNVNT